MRRLNNIQKIILWIGILFIIAMTFYPPWTAVTNPPEYDVTHAIGYGSFISPPESHFGYESYIIINYGRLFLQWVGMSSLAGIFMWLFRTK
ncbi:MAG: hypothetical protein IH596_03855 [Bacteroidales bacterium]|nr:hypothetical protein [Bacteroidales bacterium]